MKARSVLSDEDVAAFVRITEHQKLRARQLAAEALAAESASEGSVERVLGRTARPSLRRRSSSVGAKGPAAA